MKKSFFGRYSPALTINHGESVNTKDAKWYQKSVPCRSACPADTDIPGYLEAIYNQDYEKAIKPYTVFLYSHREPFRIDNLEIRNFLNSTSNNCVPNQAKLKIIDQIMKHF